MEGEVLRGALWTFEAWEWEEGILQMEKDIPGGLDELTS